MKFTEPCLVVFCLSGEFVFHPESKNFLEILGKVSVGVGEVFVDPKILVALAEHDMGVHVYLAPA